MVEKEFFHDHYVRLETDITFNDLMLTKNGDKQNDKTARNS